MSDFVNKKIDFMALPAPDDSILFFEKIKILSEEYWEETLPDERVYGFQIQQKTKWRNGLNNAELQAFEIALGFDLPVPLKNFYRTMNGLTKPGINFYGDNGLVTRFQPVFYSYPNDLDHIKELINFICNENSIDMNELGTPMASRIFPVYVHRFMLIDVPNNPILSMYGNDIIYWADNLSKSLCNEIFNNIFNSPKYENDPSSHLEIKFWLD